MKLLNEKFQSFSYLVTNKKKYLGLDFFVSSLLLWASLLLVAGNLCAEPQSAQASEELFQAGIQAFQAKDFEKAQKAFRDLIGIGVLNSNVFNNLAISSYYSNQKSLALAYFRASLELEPGNPQAVQGLQFVLRDFPDLQPTQQDSMIQGAVMVGRSTSGIFFYSLVLLCCVSFLWILLAFLGRRKEASLDPDLPEPSFPMVGYLFGGIFLFSLFFVVVKIWDATQFRGTLIRAEVPLRSFPDGTAPELLKLGEGHEVFVRMKKDTWVQIETHENLVGWIAADNLYSLAIERGLLK